MWLWGGFSQCTDVSRMKGIVSLNHRSVSQSVSGNQHGEVQAGVSSREKEVQEGNKCINNPKLLFDISHLFPLLIRHFASIFHCF